MAISVTVLLAVIALPLLHEGLREDPEERRRAMLVVSSITTLVVVAAPLVGPLKGCVLAKDESLKARYICLVAVLFVRQCRVVQ